ncbi:putative PurR-regulated permease PerM [Clostridium tetanomorphum]|uniref:AI-2E family transporter n=1 Tax=Clostridium tetanomorphum TaxID=1553 RepID=A0A923EB33_CLOTT|nr:AI-2E family transporter [Clostridium tetanomorphum]KAJ50050.1 permease [Clostridium tetanomorphum DSM 665]MBC2399977.1 AI-2E family transporter [Clostridium tetanomorphum]MBP1865823.1 putative PurR-regulated permease PerM [Clostridium tetanomorphum]NRS85272.1 putative PurR-regulated permease PerM [Clostridium tetanomorphum]NRZ98449.1 putative PurR-regulated permease PerM [Clostridium tetanomorphum]
MQFYKNKKIRYFDLVIAIVIAFISIKVIDNYKVLFAALGKLMSIISPFIFALIIAYILNPIMSFFERKFKLRRGLSILITYILIIVAITLFIVDLLPKITSNILDMVKNIPQFTVIAQEWFNNLLDNEGIKNVLNSTGNLNIRPDFVVSKLSNIISTILDTILSKTLSITNSFIKWVFGFIISIYVLADKEKFIETTKKFIYIIMKEKKADKFLNFFRNIDYMIGLYIGTKAIDSSIIATIAFVGLSIIKSPYTLLIAIIVGITNMIPYFGPFVGMTIGFFINLFFSPIKAFIVLIFLFLLQQFDGWYLDPKLIGGKVGLPPFLIIFAVTLGGGLYGPIGMILAVPTMAVIKIYIDKILAKYGKKSNRNNDNKEEKVNIQSDEECSVIK